MCLTSLLLIMFHTNIYTTKMCGEERLIFALARDENKNVTVVLKDENLDLSCFLALLIKHKVAPFILDKLLRQPLAHQLPDSFKKKCKREIAQALIDNQIMRRELASIKTILEQQKIEFILLKGLTLNQSHLRTIGDLDILIKETDLLKAIKALRPIGYIYTGDKLNKLLTTGEKKNISRQMTWNNQYQLYNRAKGLCMELHINLFEKKRAYLEDLSVLWIRPDLFWNEKTYNIQLQCFEFSRECLLLLMCLHVAIKRSPANNTFILRNVFDIDFLVNTGLNWTKIHELAGELKVIPFLYFGLQLTKKLMKAAIPSSLLETLKVGLTSGELFLIRLHLRILKNLHTFSSFYAFLYKLLKPFVFIKSWRLAWKARLRSLLVIPCFFPPRWRLADLYNLKITSPLLAFTYLLFPVQALYRYCKVRIIK